MDYSGWSLLVCDFQRIAPFLLSCQILFLLTCQVYECKVAHRILNYYHLNRYRICRDIPVSSWYWWIVSSLFISLSVLLEVYQFYGFFLKNQLLFHWFFSVALLFSVSDSSLYWRSQERRALFLSHFLLSSTVFSIFSSFLQCQRKAPSSVFQKLSTLCPVLVQCSPLGSCHIQ